MYKSRLKAWGFSKKMNQEEALALLYWQKWHQMKNKSSHLHMTGNRFSFNRLNRYVREHPVLMRRFRAGEIPTCETAQQILLSALPPPSTLDICNLYVSNDTEKLLADVQLYIEDCFEKHHWYFDAAGNYHSGRGDQSFRLLHNLRSTFQAVWRQLKNLEDIPLMDVLDPTFRSIDIILKEESPLLLSAVISTGLCAILDGQDGESGHLLDQLLKIFFSHLQQRTRDLLGSDHRLCNIWNHCQKFLLAKQVEPLEKVFVLSMAEVEGRTDGLNELLMDIYLEYYGSIVFSRSRDAREASLRSQLDKIQPDFMEKPLVLTLRIRHAVVLGLLRCDQEKYLEAENALLLLDSYQHLGPWVLAWRCDALGYMKRVMGDLEGAEMLYKTAAFVTDDENWSQAMLVNLEQVLRAAGKDYEATAVHEYRRAWLLGTATIPSIDQLFEGLA